ncbi:AAA domain-containing protein [Terrimonas pollutisoli]|uniref:AAA domain-containing protein n=1 Tax=Terrimonas pollutisoli TaxID=3034147 RepID=UPI0023ED4C16|nr:AAA domain-containing protein [Terrimonas sp. H1YJ31]
METQRIVFHQFLETAFDNGNYATDDVIAFVMPLFEEVLGFHEAGLVAPFEKEHTLFISDNRLDIDEQWAHNPVTAKNKLKELFASFQSKQFDIVGKTKMEADVDEGTYRVENMLVHFNSNETLQYPAFIKGYNCFEVIVGHHDAQTDIFCLGLVLGSMALGLDLNDEEDLKMFVEYRRNPVQYNHRIHPTISSLITEMTELDRHKRTPDLYDVIHRLQHYRDYDPEKQTDLSNVAGWVNKELKERSQFILNKLRNRLFDTSRRNRLLFYKPNMRFVNLTVSSVPMVLHYQSIRPDLLFTWNSDVSSKVAGMKEIVLNKYLRFEDHQYLPSALDKIRVESQRDVQEYGFSQLKLVITFLNWHNLKEDAQERIQSPLLLIPVELKKTKRLKEDHYTMKVLDNAAEVNPVLANQLRELYGIKLPDFVDLDDMSLEQFYQLLKQQIDEANQGIQLQYIDRPRIKLVHSVAKQTVTNYKKRLKRSGGQLDSYKNISYSYQPEHYKPLGLEIFKQRIEPRATFLEFLVSEDIKIASQQLTGNNVKERELFEMTDSESNPYSWDFDLCSIVLGNFNYKKMSLVRDYNHVIDNKVQHGVFESLFSNQPKQTKEYSFDLNKPDDWHHVITADPTQTQAILQSRTGDSYIIQGPPGTGKSQTITNLVADFVARGKSILFVCEKRAALDVVYHRLKQNGLDELCCYIHDSQGDKREFIKNLKATYEDFSRNKMDLKGIQANRTALLQKMNEQIQLLQRFHLTNTSQPGEAGIEIRKLIDRIIELKPNIVQLQPRQQELLPAYNDWLQFGETIQQLSDALEETGADASFAEHSLSKLNDAVFIADNPLNLLDSLVQHTKNLLNEINTITKECNIDTQHCEHLEQVKNLVQDAILLQPLAEHDNLQLVDTNNPAAKDFDEKISRYKQLKQQHEQAKQINANWKTKFSEQDTVNAIALAEKNEKSFLGLLNGSWRRLKKQLKESYDFSAHHVRPSFSSILQQLKAEYETATTTLQSKEQLQQQYRLDNIDTTYLGIEVLRGKKGDKEIDYLLAHLDANNIVKRLYKVNNTLHQLELQLQQCLHDYAGKPVRIIQDDLESIAMNADSLQDLLPALKQYAALPVAVKKALRNIPLTPLQAEATMAHKTLQQFYQQNKTFAGTDVNAIEKAVHQVQHCYKQLLKLNAGLIRASIRQRFIGHVEISNTALSQLNPEQKQFKKNYNEGRKILENEFGKSMRYKSIRELSAKESGLVLKDIKPVWLMSPLSVSDSLPLDTNYFDVVIFDEASQITLEEGIPSLYRSPQTIVVGDDKQMPPTNFFTAKAEDPDDLESFQNEEEDELLSADADSLLVQGSRKLSSTMLSWHYRSHYETLISYSNHAFYEAGLLTIPDRTIHHKEKRIIEITKPEEAEGYADCLYDRSISFHFHPNSVYEKRNNSNEAAYIANLVRELLKRKVKESIGIVAFSQEQQHTIEDALTALAQTDKEFEQLLEEAYNRTEEDQFVGLIIKNLENIQGDERDIIIMSVCYGFDARKKMLMNFGPINKKGGEKRLNVIFSRAKKHMAVISSIQYHHITNEYNEGANYFRRFLQYAENVSGGNMQTARTILDSLVVNKKENGSLANTTVVLKEIKQRLERQGYEVTEQVGQSDFKCSLAVKAKPGDEEYTLSILIDDERHYNNANLVEQYYQRPAILQSFGWRSMHVFGKDWLQQPEKVMEQIEKRIKEEPVAEITTEEITEPAGVVEVEQELTRQTEERATTQALSMPGFENVEFERLVFTDATSNKFWEAAVQDDKLIVRYGRVGAKGQVQVKTFADAATTAKEKEKMVKEKLGKGYRIV